MPIRRTADNNRSLTRHHSVTCALAAWMTLLTTLVPVVAQTDTAPSITGSLTTDQGVRVLRLWGTPYQQGYAHGYLLGEHIIGFLEKVLFDPRLMSDPHLYESMIRGALMPKMQFSTAETEELSGLLDGMKARLGHDQLVLQRVRRPLDLEDLKAINTLADWCPTACSSFAAWGRFTPDGQTIVARNLDYFDLSGIIEQQLLVVYLDPPPGKKKFVCIGWPSLIGVYTAMNEDGVVVATHDAPAFKSIGAERLSPRSLVLREVVETATAEDTARQAADVLRQHQAFRGNNFLVAAPFRGQTDPAVVLEYDGDTSRDGGATLRMPGCLANGSPSETIVCTNHYRLRAEPVGECRRYEAIRARLADWPADHRLDYPAALDIVKSAAVSGTVHTLIAFPNRKEFYVHLATPTANATQCAGVRLRLADLWAR
jgi:hypothetical protein